MKIKIMDMVWVDMAEQDKSFLMPRELLIDTKSCTLNKNERRKLEEAIETYNTDKDNAFYSKLVRKAIEEIVELNKSINDGGLILKSYVWKQL